MRVLSAGLVVAAVLMAGCGAVKAGPDPKPGPTDTRGAVLVRVLADPENVTEVGAWAGMTEVQAAADAQAACTDLNAEMPLADVWRAEMARGKVGTFDADFFVRTAARLYCPARMREASGA